MSWRKAVTFSGNPPPASFLSRSVHWFRTARIASNRRETSSSPSVSVKAIGESLARSIRDLIVTGRLPMLDRLRGETDHVAVLASVPGIGEAMAKRLHHDLSIDTLEELESAAHDGRLSEIEGIGPKKLAGIIDSLASRLGRVRGQPGHVPITQG